VLSNIVRVPSAIAIAVLYVFVARFHVAWFSEGIVGAFRFGAAIWMALAAPVAIESAIYIQIHSMVLLG